MDLHRFFFTQFIFHDIQTEVFKTTKKTTFNQTSTLNFVPESTGLVMCTAKNGNTEEKVTRANVYVLDLNEELAVWSNNELPISIGDVVSVTCGASAHKYTTDLSWYKDGYPVESTGSTYRFKKKINLSKYKFLIWCFPF